MKIFPAIDLLGGAVVRLSRGDYDAADTYSTDPLEVARGFREDGGAYLHIVDLDGAKSGEPVNHRVISEIAGTTDMFVQTGGGIRSLERIEAYLSIGVSRCILGTAAVNDREFLKNAIREFGEGVAVGVDARDGLVAVSGWRETTSIRGTDFCRELAGLGVSTVIYTDISRDGMLAGPNHEIYRELCGIAGLNIIASGGVTTVDDIKALKKTQVYGAIIGKALYTGKINLRNALEVASC